MVLMSKWMNGVYFWVYERAMHRQILGSLDKEKGDSRRKEKYKRRKKSFLELWIFDGNCAKFFV